ncbi:MULTISPECIES: polyprenyl synthetase family protein [Nocardia]|uniref:polyprenyl synthetase family protein n=1 Tax=Nocardia TaxID=1817 RepID=UPI0024552244|nr:MULTISPECIES: polyprenyl synthetase family protein [Nocardia]
MSTTEPLVDQSNRPRTVTNSPSTQAQQSSVADLLSEARILVTPHLRASVAALPHEVRRIASYHFGWADNNGRTLATDRGWGKGVRPALVLASARAVGGDPVAAVPAAAAVQLVHEASLIQDDVLDHDAMRRHRPAVWAVFGVPAAVLVADALFFASVRALMGGSSQHAAAATQTLIDDVQCLVAGELADTQFETRREVSLAQCWAMTAAKTGALMGSACALGARYGDASPERIHAVARFGHHVGIAFQCLDDYLGIWGDDRTGKPVRADLRRRKKSLPVAYALEAETSAAAELAALYQQDKEFTDLEAQQAAELIERTGAHAWVLGEARKQVDAALANLAEARPTPDGRDQLTALARHITHRNA